MRASGVREEPQAQAARGADVTPLPAPHPPPTRSVPQSAGKPRAPAAVTVTVLSNGLRVASQDAGGAVSSVALHLKAGSRYDELPGTAAVLGAMAFKASTRRSAAKTRRDIEGIGATVDARVSRETIVYSGAWKIGAGCA